MPDATDVAISVTKAVGAAARLSFTLGREALPVIQFIAGFVPGAAPVVQAISWALPAFDKIGQFAPVVAEFEGNERDLINHLAAVAPKAIEHLRHLYVEASTRDGKHITLAEVVPEMIYEFAIKGVIERSYFTPQDPRFQHGSDH